MVSLAATGLTLTATSTPTEIYTQIGSLTELRRQANLFEAAVTDQQPDGGKQHFTCFKLYQAVRSAKKRDNKKDKTEQLYSTLAAAFDAHRRKTLNQDCEEDESSVSRRAEKSAARRKTIDPSSLSPSPSALSIATPAAAAAAASTLCQEVPQSIHEASSSSLGPTHEQSSHSSPNGSEASSTSLDHSSASDTVPLLQPSSTCAIPRRPEEMDEIRRILCQLLESTSSVQAQLRAVEEKVCSLQTQLSGYQQLLTTWGRGVARDPQDPQVSAPAEPVSSSASSIGDRSPSSPPPLSTAQAVQAQPVVDWEQTAETTNDGDIRPQTTPTSPAHSTQSSLREEARNDGADDNAEAQDVNADDSVVDAAREPHDDHSVESASNRRYGSSKRSRSPSEDGEMRTKRHPYNAPLRSDRYPDNGAAVDATTESDGRCVWVQSQWEMCQDDLTMIFSHFGCVDRVDVPRPRPGSLPFAFVHFETAEDATQSLVRAVDGAFGCLMVKAYRYRQAKARRPHR